MVTDTNPVPEAEMRARDVSVFYGAKKAVDSVSIDIPTEYVTAFIGPSGCGKSTFLRAMNRMNDTIPGARVEGCIELDGEDIYRSQMDVVQLRARVGKRAAGLDHQPAGRRHERRLAAVHRGRDARNVASEQHVLKALAARDRARLLRVFDEDRTRIEEQLIGSLVARGM